MEPNEALVTGIDKALAAGRWFESEDDMGIILPLHIAKFLDMAPGDLGKECWSTARSCL